MKKKTIAIAGGLGRIGLALTLKFAQNNFNVLVGDNNIKKDGYASLGKDGCYEIHGLS